MTITQILKSKTINFNALYLALIAVMKSFGMEIDETVVAAGATLLNWILRAFTNKPLSEK